MTNSANAPISNVEASTSAKTTSQDEGQPYEKSNLVRTKRKLFFGFVVLLVVFVIIFLVLSGRRRTNEGTTAGNGVVNSVPQPEGGEVEVVAPTQNPGSSEFLGLTRGSLVQGQSETVNIDLKSEKETQFYLTWVGVRPELTLTRPDGVTVDQDYVLGHLNEVNLENSDSPPQLVYIVHSPSIGNWKMNITANGQVDYQVFAIPQNAPGEEPSSVTSIPTTSPRNLQVNSNNNKVYLTGRARENPVDRDGDGLYEYLELFVEINSGAFIEVDIDSVLGSGDNYITETEDRFKLKSGLQEVPIIYYGADFLESELDGPYSLLEISVTPINSNISGDQKEKMHVTRSFNYTQFESIGSDL